MVVVEILKERDYHTVESRDGASAMKAFSAFPVIDLVITDVGLPNGMNGRQLPTLLERSGQELPYCSLPVTLRTRC
ncbi:hypothetical protein [Herminiimonas sp.]|uniref:hypothetical protein n=1 Tax=Herminiimonas sp. TaxID=1926289 RepID=UPI00351F5B89